MTMASKSGKRKAESGILAAFVGFPPSAFRFIKLDCAS
jgi:hypothetical protein